MYHSKLSRMDHISGKNSIRSTIRNREIKVLEDLSLRENQPLPKSGHNSVIRKDLADSRGLSLKLDSIRNDNGIMGIETSRSRDRGNSFRNLPLTSREPSIGLRQSFSGFNFDQPCANNIEDVYERVEIYNYLIGLFSEYS